MKIFCLNFKENNVPPIKENKNNELIIKNYSGREIKNNEKLKQFFK
jgi:hypothetical protein